MSEPRPSRLRRTVGALGRLSPALLAVVGITVAVGVGGSGYYAYQMYDFVEHDNDFCLSCHLMEEPFELFAESAHQGLGCKACHQPSLMGRSQMALTQILDNPDELSVHADVPNEVCADCHIDGDPERWRSIAASPGHSVHLESDDPVLGGLQCVECHSTSLHEFAPIDRTCAQSGCHEDNVIQLGAMSGLTIHCAACHGFVEPEPTDGVGFAAAGLSPDGNECFSCHVMRTLVDMPAPDPHQGSCGSCHNPHTQATPAEAAGSCAASACHASVRETTPYHRGIDTDVVSDCMGCHVAHDFELQGGSCASCHDGVAAAQPGGALTATNAAALAGSSAAAPLGGAAQERPPFSHELHEIVGCASCHTSTDQHGEVTVTTLADCRSCHHTEPVSARCVRCHEAADAPTESFTFTRAVTFSVGSGDPARELTFPHDSHSGLDCASCHTEGLALEVTPNLDCQSCHEEHHTPVTTCAGCHRVAPESAHPPAEAHVTCSGAACHQTVPFESVPRNREFCLGCHQDEVDHEPGGVCVSCHALPAPRPGGAAQP